MTIRLKRAWTDDSGTDHEAGAELTLTANEELALVNGQMATKTSPVQKPAAPPQKKEQAPEKTEAELKADLRQSIVDAGGEAPHPSTGIPKLTAILAEIRAANEKANAVEGGTDSDSLEGGASNDTLEAGVGNDTVSAGSENDTVNASAGNDTLTG
ncbi:MAG: hypothetical protein AAF479_05920 [Pseudomonadota bacterium]